MPPFWPDQSASVNKDGVAEAAMNSLESEAVAYPRETAEPLSAEAHK
jgi:hypothetical protein